MLVGHISSNIYCVHKNARFALRAAGSRLPLPVVSTGKEIMISFTSDEFVTESGFVFGWTSTVAGQPLQEGSCSRHCRTNMIGNGVCDVGCMNAECRWDDEDCSSTCEGRDGHTCHSSQLGNGRCEPVCMTAACNFDHRDVSSLNPTRPLLAQPSGSD